MTAAAVDSSAAQALSSAIAQLGCEFGVLFEQAGPVRPFLPSASTHTALGPDAEFSPTSLLPRWLRTNGLVLPFAGGDDILDRLAPAEVQFLASVRANVAVPLITGRAMAGWIVAFAPGCNQAFPFPPPQGIEETAEQLLLQRRLLREKARQEVLARSNRLSLAGQMAAGVAHEVRNPMAAVRSIVQMVRNEIDGSGEHAQLLERVLGELDRVNGVLTSMLSLGQPTPDRSDTVDLANLVVDAVTFCSAYAKARSQEISVEMFTRPAVVGDAHELRQVLVNVLLNACQASRAGQAVVVQVDTQPMGTGNFRALVRVVDEGTGIPPELLARVFDPFFTTKADGGGLGLSLCRDAVRRHGGDIVLSSSPGAGTAVSLWFPLKA